MKIYKTTAGFVIENEGKCFVSTADDWDAYINRDDLFEAISTEIDSLQPVGETSWLATKTILAPIQSQEIWASGVTYIRSRDARMEESKDAGGDTFYDKVYVADRPELFFKATAQRTVGPNDFVRIRKDSTWDVPEPELTLCMASSGKIVGYTIGNDMSSRSIEGENPLYLPQAKTYDKSAALGPCIFVDKNGLPADALITLQINRGSSEAFLGQISINQMKRKHDELAAFLFRECTFTHGCFLMTGTGIVPDHPFTLQSGDEVIISIEHIGSLRNIVE